MYVRARACGQTPGEDDIEPHYRRILAECAESQQFALNIDCQALYEYSAECSRLYDQLVKYPPEVSPKLFLMRGVCVCF